MTKHSQIPVEVRIAARNEDSVQRHDTEGSLSACLVRLILMRYLSAPTLALAVSALTSASPAAAQSEPTTSSTLDKMASLETEWRAREEREERASDSRIQEIEALEEQFDAAEARSEEISAVYERCVALLRGALDDLEEALDRAAARSEVPKARRRESRRLLSSEDEAEREDQKRRQARRQEEAEARERLRQLERDLRRDSIEREVDIAGMLWELRESTLFLLPHNRQRQLLLFSPESTAAIRLELEVVGLITRIQLRRTREGLRTIAQGLRNVYAAAGLRRRFLALGAGVSRLEAAPALPSKRHRGN